MSTSKYSLDSLFDYFYHAKMAEGIKPGTLNNYRLNFRFFTEYLQSREISCDTRFVTTEVIREYIVWMLGEKRKYDGHKYKPEEYQTVGLSPVTVNTRIKTLRTMFRFLYEEGKVTVNPFLAVKNVEENKEEIQILTVGQIRTLFNVPNQRRYSGFRDYVLMNLLLDGMLRINEALSLKKSDIDFEKGLVSIRAEIAKNRNQRMVPIQKQTLRLLAELIKEVSDFDSDYIFLNNYGGRMDPGNFRNQLNKYAESAGLNIRVHPHLFRHTGATMFLEAGGDIRHLQMLLGHKDLRMVMRYTHLSKASLKLQHDQYSPINQILKPLNKERKIKR